MVVATKIKTEERKIIQSTLLPKMGNHTRKNGKESPFIGVRNVRYGGPTPPNNILAAKAKITRIRVIVTMQMINK